MVSLQVPAQVKVHSSIKREKPVVFVGNYQKKPTANKQLFAKDLRSFLVFNYLVDPWKNKR